MNVDFRYSFNIASEFISFGSITYHFTDFLSSFQVSQGLCCQSNMMLIRDWDIMPFISWKSQWIRSMKTKKSKNKGKLCSCWRKLGLADFRNKCSSPSQPFIVDSHPSQISRFLLSQHHRCSFFLCRSPASSEAEHVFLVHLYTPAPHIHMHIHISWLSWFSATCIIRGLPNIRMGFKTT